MSASIPTTAMILAAGLGKRMREVSDSIPKPLVEVAGKKLIDYAFDLVSEAGVPRAVVNTHYKAEMIEAHLRTHHAPAIKFSREETPLETGGGIFNALPLLGNAPFFSMNSDVICISGTQPTLHRLAQHWQDDLLALMLLVPTEKAQGYSGAGDFFINAEGQFRRRKDGEQAPYVFTGVQILNSKLFEHSPAGPFSLNVLYNRQMGEGGWFTNIRALVHDGAWLHVGDAAGLKTAEAFLKKAPSP